MAIVRLPKYHAGNLIPMFRKAAKLRNEMIAERFTDSGGAIHCAERILNWLGLRLNYPELGHINNLRRSEKARFSTKAFAAHAAGDKVMIEHVSPLRDFTRRAIREIDRGASDEQLEHFVRTRYQLVLLTPDETLMLNRQNRSTMTEDRLDRAGITLFSTGDAMPSGGHLMDEARPETAGKTCEALTN